jgi:hypothetical protein
VAKGSRLPCLVALVLVVHEMVPKLEKKYSQSGDIRSLTQQTSPRPNELKRGWRPWLGGNLPPPLRVALRDIQQLRSAERHG